MLTPTEKKLCWGRSGSPLMDKCWYFSLLNFLDSYWVWLQSNSGNGRIYYLKNVCELPILRSASCILKFKQREKKLTTHGVRRKLWCPENHFGATLLATDVKFSARQNKPTCGEDMHSSQTRRDIDICESWRYVTWTPRVLRPMECETVVGREFNCQFAMVSRVPG